MSYKRKMDILFASNDFSPIHTVCQLHTLYNYPNKSKIFRMFLNGYVNTAISCCKVNGTREFCQKEAAHYFLSKFKASSFNNFLKNHNGQISKIECNKKLPSAVVTVVNDQCIPVPSYIIFKMFL